MLGGPFINYGAECVPDVKALLDRTMKGSAHALEFAEAVKALDNVLAGTRTGKTHRA